MLFPPLATFALDTSAESFTPELDLIVICGTLQILLHLIFTSNIWAMSHIWIFLFEDNVEGLALGFCWSLFEVWIFHQVVALKQLIKSFAQRNHLKTFNSLFTVHCCMAAGFLIIIPKSSIWSLHHCWEKHFSSVPGYKIQGQFLSITSMIPELQIKISDQNRDLGLLCKLNIVLFCKNAK